jgi:hypothetical protein
MPAIEKYLFNWAMNKGHEDKPYPGTINSSASEYLGRVYGPMHLYHEINYPQHEVFLIVDYCTVHTPITALIRLADMSMPQNRPDERAFFMEYAEKIADFLCRRGFSFPTEGEQMTEDGSMSCTVISLLWAYLRVKPKTEYLTLAEEILSYHGVLELESKCLTKEQIVWEKGALSRCMIFHAILRRTPSGRLAPKKTVTGRRKTGYGVGNRSNFLYYHRVS